MSLLNRGVQYLSDLCLILAIASSCNSVELTGQGYQGEGWLAVDTLLPVTVSV